VILISPANAVNVYFQGPSGSLQPVARPGATVADAAHALVLGPTPDERLNGLVTAIPDAAAILSVDEEDNVVTVNVGNVTGPLADARVDAMIEQFAALGESTGVDVRLLFNGKAADSVRYPEVPVVPRPQTMAGPNAPQLAGTLSGKRITISPGHGWYWTGSNYTTQRGIYCALEEEDFHNLRISLYLMAYLQADGATIYKTRETNLNRGNHPLSGKPWWQMDAPFYLCGQGYSKSVYSPMTNTAQPGVGTVNQLDDDRRSRPEASNADATDLYLALHTNALSGDCYGQAPPASPNCPTGIEMYADKTQVGGYYAQSLNLGTKAQSAIYAAVRAAYNPSYPCRNNCVPRTDQAFTEIHYPTRPACLLEFGFHDSCDTDAASLKDEVFRSAGMWGYYKGVCDYFGVTPTWDLRSYELVSQNLPIVVKTGSSWTSAIVLKNHGCVWNEQHQFRLAAANGLNPFGPSLRYTITGNIGPGENATFNIPMTAPTADGSYISSWRMVQDERSAFFGATISRTILVDGLPPSLTAVQDGGPYQTSTTLINATWTTSLDAKAGLNRYEYRLADSAGSLPTVWISNGATTYVSLYGAFVKGRKYYVQVKAIDNVGNESAVASSAGVVIVPDPKTIGAAKADADGAYATLDSETLSSIFTDHIYVQQPDRSSGIRVNGVWALSAGSKVRVYGQMATAQGERLLQSALITALPDSPVLPVPLSMGNRQLGGEPFNGYTSGVVDLYGLNNIGLLVTVFGTVTENGPTGFRINDGGLNNGVWIECGAFHKPSLGQYAVVTGVSSVQSTTGQRQVKVWRDADIQP
ncbi:MAG: N-acetylmuramoyl-L-alanine amidase, partial [Armatimonadota bacterium]